MNIEVMKQALELLRKKEWEACDYTSNASEAADILEKAIATEESSATQEPKREWVWLTLDERLELAQDVDWAAGAYCEYAEAVEEKLKEKNA